MFAFLTGTVHAMRYLEVLILADDVDKVREYFRVSRPTSFEATIDVPAVVQSLEMLDVLGRKSLAMSQPEDFLQPTFIREMVTTNFIQLTHVSLYGAIPAAALETWLELGYPHEQCESVFEKSSAFSDLPDLCHKVSLFPASFVAALNVTAYAYHNRKQPRLSWMFELGFLIRRPELIALTTILQSMSKQRQVMLCATLSWLPTSHLLTSEDW